MLQDEAIICLPEQFRDGYSVDARRIPLILQRRRAARRANIERSRAAISRRLIHRRCVDRKRWNYFEMKQQSPRRASVTTHLKIISGSCADRVRELRREIPAVIVVAINARQGVARSRIDRQDRIEPASNSID